MGTSFDLGFSEANQRLMQQRQIAEQQRVQQQNTVGARLLDSINNASNIKPQMKDEQGNIVDNPAYAQAQKDKQDLITQYMGLNSPQQHATFADRLHGLIFGHPTDQHQQPALSPNSSPVAPPVPPPAQGQPAAPPPAATPPHPFETNNPILAKMQEGLGALKNHLKAAANPLTPPPTPDAEAIARNYRDPGQVAAERQQALWGVRGENAVKVAEIRKDALLASLQARPPRLLSQTTIPDLLDQIKVDPTMTIYGPEGKELTPSQLAEMPPGTIAREFRAGSQIFYALGDQNSKTLKVGNEVYNIPAVGPINSANSTALGVANPSSTSAHTDPFGLTDTTKRTPTTTGITAPPPPGPAPANPVLLRRPDGLANPVPATVQPVNPGARAPGTQPGGGAIKAKPVSSAAPSVPSQPTPLDADGHIPSGVGNDLVRQYANNLLDGQDSLKIPNPRARAAAEQLASQYGWSQGAFTPREKIQFQTATTFLKQLQDSPSLSALDSFVSREKIARAMKDPKSMGLVDRIAAYNLNPQEAEFLRLYNAALGTVQGLASITRSGRTTEASVNRLKTELPNVLQSPNSADAKARIDQLLKEANVALGTNPMNVGKKGPTSANAPKAPLSQAGPEVWTRDASGKLVQQVTQ
jgi:hypothetical protein